MAKARFTDEQIAEILQQSKKGAPNKELCEHYQFSVSTLRRWQEQHAEGVRSELKKNRIQSANRLSAFLCRLHYTHAYIWQTYRWMGNTAFITLLCLLYSPVSQHLRQTH